MTNQTGGTSDGGKKADKKVKSFKGEAVRAHTEQLVSKKGLLAP
jgi:hypothetical protein